MYTMMHENNRRQETETRCLGSDTDTSSKASGNRRESRVSDQSLGNDARMHLQMDSEISGRRNRGTQSEAAVRPTAKVDGAESAMDIQDGYHEESFAITVSLCLMDPGDG